MAKCLQFTKNVWLTVAKNGSKREAAVSFGLGFLSQVAVIVFAPQMLLCLIVIRFQGDDILSDSVL
jgi:hypothetical protein